MCYSQTRNSRCGTRNYRDETSNAFFQSFSAVKAAWVVRKSESYPGSPRWNSFQCHSANDWPRIWGKTFRFLQKLTGKTPHLEPRWIDFRWCPQQSVKAITLKIGTTLKWRKHSVRICETLHRTAVFSKCQRGKWSNFTFECIVNSSCDELQLGCTNWLVLMQCILTQDI